MITRNGKDVVAHVVGNSTFGRYSKISSQIQYNMFTSDGWQVSAFGYKKVGELPTTSNATGRGQFKSTRNDIVLSVIGSTVILIDSNLVANIVGTLSSSQGIVSFAQNLSNQICIVDGQSNAPYIFNVSERSLTKQEASDGFTPNYVDYHDTYFLFGNKNFTGNGSKFLIYEYDTESTIKFFAEGALQTQSDFALAAVAIPAGGNNILVYGRSVTEVQTNVGGQLVYQRNSSMSINYGVVSVASIASNDHIAWLGQNKKSKPCIMCYSPSKGFRKVTQIDSQGNKRTDGIFYLIENTKYPEESFATMSVLDGHEIYMLTFPNEADDFTICYDFNSDGFFFLTDYAMHYFPAVDIVYFNKSTYFCSYNNSAIYEIGSKYTTYNENMLLDIDENNRVIPRVVITDALRYENADNFIANIIRLVAENGNNIDFNALTLDSEVTFITDEDGDYLTTETGDYIVTETSESTIPYVPKIDLAYSIDGGKTWSMYIQYTYNFDAFRQSIVQWDGLGGANDVRLKFRFWTKSSVVVNNAVVEVKK